MLIVRYVCMGTTIFHLPAKSSLKSIFRLKKKKIQITDNYLRGAKITLIDQKMLTASF